MPVKQMEGSRYSRLLVIERSGSDNYGRATWLCRCDCGASPVVAGYQMRSGKTRSCGCLQNEIRDKRVRTHGHSVGGRSPTYNSWQSMKTRCTNSSNPDWEIYGGRGITACVEWRESFEQFLADMEVRPEGRTLDRIDSDGNYEPGNCRWATPAAQQLNRRPYTCPRGADAEAAKCTEAQVDHIRKAYATGEITQQVLADQFGLHQSTVSDIVLYKSWKRRR